MNNITPGSLQYDIVSIIDFINRFLVPFVFAIAFALFLFGVFQFFFLKGTDSKARTEGRGFIIGGIIAFAVMLSVWGLVNIIKGSIPGLSQGQPDLPTFNATTGTKGTLPAQIPAQGTNLPAQIPAQGSGLPAQIPAQQNNPDGSFSGSSGADTLNSGSGNDTLR
ncbi:MAG: hypothetical protein JWL88_476 [Parcubacteria group bacterium]|nr:hypothetical protein [Parcubacteria group bacterium]